MQMLSEDDRNLVELTDDELALAWDLWFDLAQATNSDDPPYTHGVFAAMNALPRAPAPSPSAQVSGTPPSA